MLHMHSFLGDNTIRPEVVMLSIQVEVWVKKISLSILYSFGRRVCRLLCDLWRMRLGGFWRAAASCQRWS